MAKGNDLIGVYQALAKLICRLPSIEQQEALKDLRFHIAHEAKKMHPDASNSKLSQITGISRGAIADYLEMEEPKVFTNKDSVVLSELWNAKDKFNTVPLHGENSFFSIAKSILTSSYKPESTLKALIETDAVEITERGLLIKTYQLDNNINDKRLCHLVNKTVKRYVDTVIYNFDKNNKDKLFEQTHQSTLISPMDAKELNKEAKLYLNKSFIPYIRGLFDKYESDVELGTYPICSLSVFQYMESFLE